MRPVSPGHDESPDLCVCGGTQWYILKDTQTNDGNPSNIIFDRLVVTEGKGTPSLPANPTAIRNRSPVFAHYVFHLKSVRNYTTASEP